MESFHVENGDHQFEMANLLKEPSSSLRSISPTKLQTASLVTLTVILIGFALHWLRPVLVPLVIAVAVSYVFIPILDLLTSNLKFPKSVAVLVTLAFGSSVFGFLLWLVVSSVRQITVAMMVATSLVVVCVMSRATTAMIRSIRTFLLAMSWWPSFLLFVSGSHADFMVHLIRDFTPAIRFSFLVKCEMH